MKYVKYTHVDSVTGIPCTVEPMLNGPMMPQGIDFVFALESEYPTYVPTFYGTTNLMELPDYVTELTQEEFERDYASEIHARQTDPIRIKQESDYVRSQRDGLLAQTDWLVKRAMSTNTLVEQEIADYRQALRDITTQEGFPFNIEWPTNPLS